MLKQSFFSITLILLAAFSIYAGVPQQIDFQGMLTDADGKPIHGTYTIQFSIYNSPTEGAVLWTEIQNVTVSDGLLSVVLGSVKPIPPKVFNTSETYIEIKVGDDPAMKPRKRLLSVGYALHATNADSLNGHQASDFIRSMGGVPPKNGNIELVGGENIIIVPDTTQNMITISAAGSLLNNGLTLPFQGTVESSVPAFSITNTGTGRAAVFAGTNSSSSNYVLEVTNSGQGSGLYCTSSTYGVLTRTSGEWGRSIYAIATGGHGMGVCGSSSGEYGWGVYGFCSKNIGVYGVTNTGYGGYFRAQSSSGIGLYAKGGLSGKAAEFQGNVVIREYNSGTIIMELGQGLDYAEGFNISDDQGIEPGTVLSIDPDHPGKLTKSNRPYDSKVAGIVAGANGLGSGVRLGVEQFDHDVALAGRVYCNVDATDVAVAPGDLLTTSATPGFAMKATDPARAPGAILGKAMECLEKGKTGQILVLVTLQ